MIKKYTNKNLINSQDPCQKNNKSELFNIIKKEDYGE